MQSKDKAAVGSGHGGNGQARNHLSGDAEAAATGRSEDGTVGVVGLGLIGTAFSERLLEGKVSVLGYDVDPTRRDALKSAGGDVARSAEDVISQCRTTILVVFDGPQVLEIIDALHVPQPSGRAGKRIVLSTTCPPEAVERIAAACDRKGVSMLEFPVSGTSRQVRAGEALGLVAGPRAMFDELGPVLSVICPRSAYLGDVPGNASKAKLAINLVVLLNRTALAEGLVFAGALGLDQVDFLEALRASAAYSQIMDTKGRKMIDGDFAPQSRIRATLKDAGIIEKLAADAGKWLPLTQANTELLRHTAKMLGDDVDPSAVIEGLRRPRA